MRKLRDREVKSMDTVTQLINGKSLLWSQALLASEIMLYTSPFHAVNVCHVKAVSLVVVERMWDLKRRD